MVSTGKRAIVPASRVLTLTTLLAVLSVVGPAVAQEDFRRGDVNSDGEVNVADVYIPLFLGGLGPACLDAADSDDNGAYNITDVVYLLNFCYVGGPEPPDPGPFTPGPDPTPDNLTCSEYSPEEPPQMAAFSLGIECEPLTVTPGMTFQHEAVATLASSAGNSSGAKGWSISLALEGEGLQMVTATTDGTVAAPVPDGLMSSGFEHTEIVNPLLDLGSGPQGQGVVSSVILSFLSFRELEPGSSVPVARITLEGGAPAGDPLPTQLPARLYYTDGLQGSGEPVRNIIYYRDIAQYPDLGSTDLEITVVEPWQRPGDYTQDGVLDMSDAISVLQGLFLGSVGPLPCGESGLVAPANLQLLDSNGDAKVDVTDAIHVLGFLFLGTSPPVLGTECVPIVGCPPACS